MSKEIQWVGNVQVAVPAFKKVLAPGEVVEADEEIVDELLARKDGLWRKPTSQKVAKATEKTPDEADEDEAGEDDNSEEGSE